MRSDRREESTMAVNQRSFGWLALLAVVIGAATFGVTALLVSIFEHKQEARAPIVKVVDVDETSTDPAPWGLNYPLQYEAYRRTVDTERTEHGGSSALPPSKLEKDPWLKRLYAGYAFSVDYREARGHAYMLDDQEMTRRVTEFPQGGSCLHCHASVVPTYRRLGLEKQGKPAGAEQLAAAFDQDAVVEGFRLASKMKYHDMLAELKKTPDRTTKQTGPTQPSGAAKPTGTATATPTGTPKPKNTAEPAGTRQAGDPHLGNAHPVSCIDCHDPKTMQIRVTRPGFIESIAALAASSDPVPHLPSIAEWRKKKSGKPYDPNRDASRQEMRSFVCGQCHVEYYCAAKMPLTFPWKNGLKADDLERTWSETKFPDGGEFFDYVHKETDTKVFKVQHPEFELWSQGIHARAGVSCSDCHMPYERQGATKVSSHWVRSPMLNVNRACQVCHHSSGEELRARVDVIQGRTRALVERSAAAMTDMLDAIVAAKSAGATDDELKPIRDLQRRAMWRLDFVSSENSKGFHADQESARILAESLDYSRQAQAAAYKLEATKKTAKQ
jgi:nitrite reductase (cytochrome c-552)